jgi:hypothetical protein
VTLVIATAITPLTATFFAALFIGPSLPISAGALGLKLVAMLAGAAIVAALLRRVAGDEAIARQAERIDGTNVILLFIFVVALMDGVAVNAIADPKLVIGLVALAFALSFGLTALTTLIFACKRRSPSASAPEAATWGCCSRPPPARCRTSPGSTSRWHRFRST